MRKHVYLFYRHHHHQHHNHYYHYPTQHLSTIHHSTFTHPRYYIIHYIILTLRIYVERSFPSSFSFLYKFFTHMTSYQLNENIKYQNLSSTLEDWISICECVCVYLFVYITNFRTQSQSEWIQKALPNIRYSFSLPSLYTI